MGKNTARVAIRVWLAEHDRPQVWLAQQIGINEGTLSTIVNGYKPASDEVADSLKRITGIDIRKFAKVA